MDRASTELVNYRYHAHRLPLAVQLNSDTVNVEQAALKLLCTRDRIKTSCRRTEHRGYLLHSYICSSLSTEDREKNLYPDLVPTAKDLFNNRNRDKSGSEQSLHQQVIRDKWATQKSASAYKLERRRLTLTNVWLELLHRGSLRNVLIPPLSACYFVQKQSLWTRAKLNTQAF